MKGCALALGMFDGVHIGHQAVLRAAADSPYQSVAVTFESIPFKKDGLLLTASAKSNKIRELGVDQVLFLDFAQVQDMTPNAFLRFLRDRYDVRKICCGFNYRFGRNAVGDTSCLKRYCAAQGIEYFESPAVSRDGQIVSSTRIRDLIADGQTERASELLGEPFAFEAPVVLGDQRGRTMGFPTANQRYDEALVLPRFGVYQTVVTLDGKRYDGITNLGRRPTFKTDFISAETHILNYAGDCYGAVMKTELIAFLRPEKRFDTLNELIAAIDRNVAYVKAHRVAVQDR